MLIVSIENNMNDDTWRALHLIKNQKISKAPIVFDTGNIETLWTEPKRDGLDMHFELK
jgi:secreted Zn-dependent insulinase-like peptidase